MTVTVESASPDYLETIHAGRHVFQVDEPVEAGGKDAVRVESGACVRSSGRQRCRCPRGAY
jgi:hypothetical protein